MSSTNRGGERSADDFYATPGWAVTALLRRLPPLAGKSVLEPSAGAGAIVKHLLLAGAQPEKVTAVEIDAVRAEATEKLGVDVFLCAFDDWCGGKTPNGFPGWFDLVVMNPPFSLAEQHIRLAISLLAPGGLCCALERLAFGCSRKRASFRAAHRYDKFELACRPAFNGGGATDSADYAWFLFGTRADGTPCGGRFETIEEGPPR